MMEVWHQQWCLKGMVPKVQALAMVLKVQAQQCRILAMAVELMEVLASGPSDNDDAVLATAATTRCIVK